MRQVRVDLDKPDSGTALIFCVDFKAFKRVSHGLTICTFVATNDYFDYQKFVDNFFLFILILIYY